MNVVRLMVVGNSMEAETIRGLLRAEGIACDQLDRHATGANGPFEMNGMDRTRVRDGLVCENYVFFDSSEFQQLVGT